MAASVQMKSWFTIALNGEQPGGRVHASPVDLEYWWSCRRGQVVGSGQSSCMHVWWEAFLCHDLIECLKNEAGQSCRVTSRMGQGQVVLRLHIRANTKSVCRMQEASLMKIALMALYAMCCVVQSVVSGMMQHVVHESSCAQFPSVQ
jgi:hypothetical protein